MRFILWIEEKIGIIPATVIIAVVLTIGGIIGAVYDGRKTKEDEKIWKVCAKRYLHKKWNYSDAKQYCIDHTKEWRVILKNESKANRKTTRIHTKSVSQ